MCVLYIFFFPESTLTIHECDQDEALEPIQPIISNNKKPPVPKRIGQLSAGDRPMVPNKTMAATMAAVKQQQMQLKQQQEQQSGHNNGKSNLPDFFINKNDMGK